MNLEDKAIQAEERMFEFYDLVELEYFIKFCSYNNLPHYESMLFLDGQTRADYLVTERDPKICDYMDRTLRYFNDCK